MSDIEEAKLLLTESGNSFHCKVIGYLKSKGWHTQISPYYMDGSTNKPREIDLIAERSWGVPGRFGAIVGTVNIKLFIECKYIPQVNVFWFAPKDQSSAKEWLRNNTPLTGSNLNDHHYINTNGEVAKLFASKSKNSVENEVVYKALNQSLNAMAYLRNGDSIIPKKYSERLSTLGTLEMPLIVCNSFDKFFRVNIEGIAEPAAIEDYFQLEINYAYVNRAGNSANEYFLVDIVDFDSLDKFLSVLELDKDAVINTIDDQRD